MTRDWITTVELADILGLSERYIRKAIYQGKLPSFKEGRYHRIPISALREDWQLEAFKILEKEKFIDIKSNLPTVYTEENKKKALTKFNLVTSWQQFFKYYKGTKIQSVKDFMKIYKNSPEYGDVYYKIDKISPCTMLRWEKKLKDNNYDWRALLNKYVSHNKKTSGLSKEEQEIFINFLLHPNKTSVGKAIKLTQHLLKEKGVTEFSCEMTYRRFAKKYIAEHYDLWVFSREGSKALREKVVPYIKRDPSKLEVGDVLVGDGHRLAFQVINPFDGKPCRPTLVGYQDWKSGGLVGFEIMLEENTQCIASALRNSIINLQKYPKYLYQDNGKAFKSKYFNDTEEFNGLFVSLGITPIYALPYNAKAKTIERFFKEMQDSFERLLPSFVGANINDQPAYLKRNEKFHKKHHSRYIPTMQEVIILLNKWLCFHYAQPCPNVEGKTIGEVLEEGKGCLLDFNQLDDMMMVSEIKSIGRNGIRFLKSDYYDEALYGLKKKVLIKYSLFDLSFVKVYTLDGEFICVAKRLEAINPLVNYTGSAKDIEDFKQRVKQQKRLEQQTANEYLKHLKRENGNVPLLETDVFDYEQKMNQDKYIEVFEESEKIENEEPIFHNKFEKYDYLKKKENPTTEEMSWIEDYEKSVEYKLIYETSEN